MVFNIVSECPSILYVNALKIIDSQYHQVAAALSEALCHIFQKLIVIPKPRQAVRLLAHRQLRNASRQKDRFPPSSF